MTLPLDKRAPIVLRLISWIVERFWPHTVVYGQGFLEGLEMDADEVYSTAALGLAVSAHEKIKPGYTLETTFQNVTDQGRSVGDYVITVKRLK